MIINCRHLLLQTDILPQNAETAANKFVCTIDYKKCVNWHYQLMKLSVDNIIKTTKKKAIAQHTSCATPYILWYVSNSLSERVKTHT